MSEGRTARVRVFVAGVALAAGAVVAGGCGAFESAGATRPLADAGFGAEGGVVCRSVFDCASNAICFSGRCRLPSGSCAASTAELTCYPNARCNVAPGTSSGQCSFLPPPTQVFQTSARIVLRTPTERTLLTSAAGFTLEWTPRPVPVGESATSIAVIMDAVPVIQVGRNQIQNRDRVVWIWSSAEPGPGATEGVVPLHAGRRGVTREGALGPPWGTEALRDGDYWWFVFTIQRGNVAASSVWQRMRVGPRVEQPMRCASAQECVTPTEPPEVTDCIDQRCARRCASDLDCPGQGSECDFQGAPTKGPRRSGVCRDPGPPDGGAGR